MNMIEYALIPWDVIRRDEIHNERHIKSYEMKRYD